MSETMPPSVTEPLSTALADQSSCGCGAAGVELAEGSGRRAVAVDPESKARNRTRLRRIEGQIRGLQQMVEDDRYCADILTQIASAHEALRAVGRELMRNHLKHCATAAIAVGGETRDAMYDELVDMMYKHSR
ncbi:MAG: metal-sensitive transcriptional regulator [Gemmatimonadota bacterium]|nr:metal-sensitive transcriptional regulator [Gemmatimonadota bacterium]